MKPTRTVPAIWLSLLPSAAHAQHVPVWAAAAALSPLLVLVLAAILGLVARSWRTAAKHAGLVVLWVSLFVIVAQTIENDYVVWTPVVLYAAHALLILILIVVHIAKRIGSGSGAD